MVATRTKLSRDEISQIFRVVASYLREHEAINNRTLRAITGIGYDQAIHFFGTLVKEGQLLKVGHSSGTKYVLNSTNKIKSKQ